jgi:aerobic carbon-monoxide dehydrogenase medium subunit
MKPARFDYYDPRTLAEAVALRQQNGDESAVLAGGQSLMPLLNMRLARPAVVIDVNRVANSDYVRAWDGGVAIGLTTRQRQLTRNPLITERFPLLTQAAEHIGHPQIRSRGTICGSLAHADPAAELPAVALALDAELVAAGPGGERSITADDFFVTVYTTSLESTEVLSEVRFPAPPADMAWSFMEVSRRHGDFAMVGAIAGLSVDRGRNMITNARLVYCGVGARPTRVADAEKALIGQTPSDEAFAAAGEVVSKGVDPHDDLHASAAYRRSVAGALARRTLKDAWGKLQ